ncbi:SRPBCC domain-containing protein [Pedobacter panaciterrae]|jgi:uncharacterized protein YndB with AHSA1/START domain|uniref:SRPBCC domain-containing protein n=1 Tax=Pedobacter panaciterrae TaxID=363849 RepID=A0ABU8NGI7_9SPHI|nr:SRPBCC domain-containing protein [Pedobacter panaciterrae]NQX57185.1 SRPBCC domain-containing protein [Pedobacter panaciterrae]
MSWWKNNMLIRKPTNLVFEAFINPEITKHFWFTKGSGRLSSGARVTWEWGMYNVSTPVQVVEIIKNVKIVIDWNDPATRVEFNFKAIDADSTYLEISQYGLHSKGEALLAEIKWEQKWRWSMYCKSRIGATLLIYFE